MTREIPLSRGLVALVDDQDYGRLIALGPWHAVTQGTTTYARHTVYADGRWAKLHMHQVVLGTSELVDHSNGDGLNNQRGNLRLASVQQNNANARRRRDNTSGFKGVSWHRGKRKWCAYICTQGRQRSLGAFDSATSAARAYDAAAVHAFGEFARLNFPREESA